MPPYLLPPLPLQIFLGCYHSEELAARAYDLASIALRGAAACTNFPAQQYAAELAATPVAVRLLARSATAGQPSCSVIEPPAMPPCPTLATLASAPERLESRPVHHLVLVSPCPAAD